ncbi:hypothetical protein FHX46_002191 [Amycolatopsis viridis]|uniref:Uncharacterized protein n=1 Tax=Amycolatopsis viridis TaxID=185678 RepID=A0ABX0SRS3_9PSEU|nr:hypothetical protein [Amycolatopsis viridis]
MLLMHARDGVVPAAFQAVQQAGLDFSGEVGIDVTDLVGDPVPQPPRLGDFGNAVGDHPGLVTVPEIVEAQSRQDWLHPHLGSHPLKIPVGRGPHRAAGKVRPPQQLVLGTDEHMRMVMTVEIGPRRRNEERRQGDGARGTRRLGRAEFELPVDFVQRAEVGIDDDLTRRRDGCWGGGGRSARPSGRRSRPR